MRLVRRMMCLGCVLTAMATVSAAQVPSESKPFPSEETMKEWLRGRDLRLLAWGAHDALVSGDMSLVPDLLRVASAWEKVSPEPGQGYTPEERDRLDAMAAVLDALIQMNVKVPPETLRALGPQFPSGVSVLLARMPQEEAIPLSLEFYRTLGYDAPALRYVSAALLALHPPEEFAGELLSQIWVHVGVDVVSPGKPAGGGASVGDCFGEERKEREGWPLTGQYSLSAGQYAAQPESGRVEIIGGIDPIYATRQLSSRFVPHDCAANAGVYLSPEASRRLVAEMLGTKPEAIGWETEGTTKITYESEAQFKRDLLAYIDDKQKKFQETAEALEAKDLLRASQLMQSFPRLAVVLRDWREPREGRLPTDANVPANVEIKEDY
jgi:hypothetical protein